MKSRIEEIKRRFEAQTIEHVLTVKKDEGLYRHLSFGPPGSGIMRVDLITWPGYLAYVGDMGAFVFSRVSDMLTFFRGSRINPSYWAEKVQAADPDQVTQWSRELFEERAREELATLIDEDDDGRYKGMEEKFEEEIIQGLDGKSKEMTYSDIIEFEHEGHRPFEDWWEVDTDVFTHRFLWCCFALVRIIALYDDESYSTELES